ncbi:MAG TPA: hypothetical protein PKA03_13840 [Tabrizicola sp.]|nr:hypothetical protein [Tabrizicola sp.]
MVRFRGMPDWAQALGEALPLVHFLRPIRAIMLKGGDAFAVTQHMVALPDFAVFLLDWITTHPPGRIALGP